MGNGVLPFMKISGAVIFLPRNVGGGAPLLTRPLPVASGAVWLTEALRRAGVSRFLVVCRSEDQPAACFPPDTLFVTGDTEDAPELLTGFLSELEGGAAVITAPVLLTSQAAARLASSAALPPGVSTGVFRIDAAGLAEALAQGIPFDQALQSRGECYGAGAEGFEAIFSLDDSPEQLQQAATAGLRAERARLTAGGVLMLDPDTVYPDPRVTVAPGTLLLPGTILRGATVIGARCEIGPNTVLQDCVVGDEAVINASQCSESTIGSHAKVGPFAYIRPGCTVGEDTKVGDFVELKNSVIGDGTKISHLTYVGDSDIGKNVNLGCGTVTVNYDGAAKFRTVVGDGAFVGCNANLIAPVRVGSGSYVAAGSTITDNVPDDGLAIARAPQTVKAQWAAKRKNKKK